MLGMVVYKDDDEIRAGGVGEDQRCRKEAEDRGEGFEKRGYANQGRR